MVGSKGRRARVDRTVVRHRRAHEQALVDERDRRQLSSGPARFELPDERAGPPVEDPRRRRDRCPPPRRADDDPLAERDRRAEEVGGGLGFKSWTIAVAPSKVDGARPGPARGVERRADQHLALVARQCGAGRRHWLPYVTQAARRIEPIDEARIGVAGGRAREDVAVDAADRVAELVAFAGRRILDLFRRPVPSIRWTAPTCLPAAPADSGAPTTTRSPSAAMEAPKRDGLGSGDRTLSVGAAPVGSTRAMNPAPPAPSGAPAQKTDPTAAAEAPNASAERRSRRAAFSAPFSNTKTTPPSSVPESSPGAPT